MSLRKQPGCWLRSSHTLKECVIAHWSSDDAPKINGAKQDTEAWEYGNHIGRGAMYIRRRQIGRAAGGYRRENAGISSESGARNSAVESLRIPGEGSSARGKSGPKSRPKGVDDGQQVENPVLPKEIMKQ